MVTSNDPGFNIGHPAPDRGRASLLFTALSLAPVAWVVQLFANFELSNRICSAPGQPAASAPDWLGIALGTINIAALALAAAAILLSWRNMRRTHVAEKTGPHGILGSGEGRTRFLAVWGILSGIMFFCAIAFNTASLFLVPLCQP